MPHFEVMIREKQALKQALLKNQRLVNLLCGTGNNVQDFEDYKLGSKSPAAELIKTHFYIPDTTEVDKNFITMRSLVNYADTNVVKEVGLTIYVICNTDQVGLLQGSRSDLIADEVDGVINDGFNPLFGLGEIRIGAAAEMSFATGYTGWEIQYTTHEFNREAKRLG